jgi:hypothetical protein
MAISLVICAWVFYTHTRLGSGRNKVIECTHSFFLQDMSINLIIKVSLMLIHLWSNSLRWHKPIYSPFFPWHLTWSLKLSYLRQWVNHISFKQEMNQLQWWPNWLPRHLIHCRIMIELWLSCLPSCLCFFFYKMSILIFCPDVLW